MFQKITSNFENNVNIYRLKNKNFIIKLTVRKTIQNSINFDVLLLAEKFNFFSNSRILNFHSR